MPTTRTTTTPVRLGIITTDRAARLEERPPVLPMIPHRTRQDTPPPISEIAGRDKSRLEFT